MQTYSQYRDEELIDLVKTGEEVAFNIIYNRYWERLFFVAVKKLQDEAEAQEAVQDIFFALWKNRNRFQLRGNLENYLSVAIKFQVIQRIAKKQRRNQIEQSLAKEGQEAQQMEINGQWNQEDLERLHEQLQVVIETLPNKCRLVFRLSRSEEYTNRKIAQELGISEKAVEKHISHALKVLRTNLGPKAIAFLLLHDIL